MPLEFSCTSCTKLLRVGDEHAGKTIRCPACGTLSTAPVDSAIGEAHADLYPPADASSPQPQTASSARWYLRTPEGKQFGPVERAELDRWVQDRRIYPGCSVRDESSLTWSPAEDFFPSLVARPPAAPLHQPGYTVPLPSHFQQTSSTRSTAYLQPHRGPLILILGILGIAMNCFLFSLFAWVMGASDLQAMAEGRMDRSGEGLTRVGYYLGMIISILAFAGIAIALLVLGSIAIAG